MKYTEIDLNTWDRGEVFAFFIENMRNVMSMTVDIDVTSLVTFVKAHGLKYYPTMMWIVSKVVNSHDEFKYGWNDDGKLIRWDYVSPYYADFHKQDERFVKLITEYSEDLLEFHTRFMSDKEKYQSLRAFDLKDIPKNTFDVSCMPWVKYKNFDIHVFDSGTYLPPVITWGKYDNENDKITMPLSMNIHHAVADGFHLCRFFNEVQELINNINDTIKI